MHEHHPPTQSLGSRSLGKPQKRLYAVMVDADEANVAC
jgi:hypothetical protein